MTSESDAERFLTLIGGALVEIRHKLPEGDMAKGRFFDDPAAAAAFALDVGGYVDTYAGMAPRIRRRGRSEDIAPAWIVFVDCDTDESLDKLARFEPAPAILIASGGVTPGGRAKLHATGCCTNRSTASSSRTRSAGSPRRSGPTRWSPRRSCAYPAP